VTDARAAATRWADVWEHAWRTADIEAISALYAEDAVFHSHPFRERQLPRAYVAWAFEGQASAECRFGTPLVDGDRAAVDWWGVIVSKDASVETIAGTSLLRFRTDGLVEEQLDVWAAEDGRVELPAWATS
jgi:hypothetical protein